MSRFIDISLEQNLSLLDRNYDPDTDVSTTRVPSDFLIAIWAEINLEYTELMDNGSMKSLLTNTAEIELLKMKFNLVTSLVETLTVTYVPELVDMLKEMGYNFQFDPKDPVRYHKDLSRVVTQSKNLVVQIRIKEAESRTLAPKEGTTGEASRDDWEDSLISLSDDAGYPLDPETMTVYQYATRYKNLMKKYQSKIKTPRLPNA